MHEVPQWAAELATRATKQKIRERQKNKIQEEKLEPPERRHPYTPEVIPHHPTAKLHPLSTVHPTAEIGARTIIEAGAQVQRNAKIDKNTIVREQSCVCENAQIGERCDIAALYVGRNAKLGDNVKLHADTSVGNNATIGDAVQLKTGARVGHDTTVHEGTKLGSHTYVHHGASIGNNVTTGQKVRIGKECTLEAHVHVDDGAVMEPGSTVCAGSKVKRNAVARKGETIPPSTLVAIDGTRRPLPIDREVRVHPDDSSRKLPEIPPPVPAPADKATHRTKKRGHDGPTR